MFAHVSLTVVPADELGAAIIARIGFDGLVGVHVGCVVRFADKGAFALVAFEGFVRPSRVRPLVEFQVPFGGKTLIAD